jgi:cytochrome c
MVRPGAWLALVAIAAAIHLAACEPRSDSTIEAPPRELAALPAALQDPRFAEADFERGELLSYACQACHTLRSGEPNMIGPNLFGVFGREAGTVPDFDYSEALRNAKFSWRIETLEAWLAGPENFLVGNAMVFAGYSDPEDRRDLIAYLLWATAADSDP